MHLLVHYTCGSRRTLSNHQIRLKHNIFLCILFLFLADNPNHLLDCLCSHLFHRLMN